MWRMPLHLHVNKKSDYDMINFQALACLKEVSLIFKLLLIE